MRFSARRTSVLLPAGDGGQGHFSRATGRDRAWTRTAAILATGRLVDRVRRQRDRTVREGRPVRVEVSPNTDTLVQGDTLRLAVLLASENELMGPIPPELRNLTNLWHLQPLFPRPQESGHADRSQSRELEREAG